MPTLCNDCGTRAAKMGTTCGTCRRDREDMERSVLADLLQFLDGLGETECFYVRQDDAPPCNDAPDACESCRARQHSEALRRLWPSLPVPSAAWVEAREEY